MGQCFDRAKKEERYEACKEVLQRLDCEHKGEPGTVYQAVSCAICLEDFATTEGDKQISKGSQKVLECGHEFHVYCIEKWLDRSQQCPLCRHDITSNRGLSARTQPAHAMPYSEYDFRVNRAHELYPDFLTVYMISTWTTPGFDGSLADDPSFVVAGDGVIDGSGGHDGGFFGIFGHGDGGHHGGDDGGGHHFGGDGDGFGDGGGGGCGGGGGGCGGGCGGG